MQLRGRATLVAFIAFLAFGSSAHAAVPKQIVNEIGAAEVGETGGLFNGPRGVAVNQLGLGGVPAGTFYVVDQKNARIQRFGPTGAFVSAWGWGVREGNEEFEVCTKAEACRRGLSGPGNSSTSSAGLLAIPQGIAVDQLSGNVYVSDRGGASRRIDVYGATGAFQGAFGLGVTGDFSEELEFCTFQTGCGQSFFVNGQGGGFPNGIGGLAVDLEGNVYVANPGYHRVDVFKPILTNGTATGVEFVRSVGWGVNAGNEEFEVCTVSSECKEGLPGAGLGQFAESSPTDVAVDSEGNVFALDAPNRRIEELATGGSVPTEEAFGAAALASVFGGEPMLFNLAVDLFVEPNHLLVSGARAGSGGKVAVAELTHSGDNALGAGVAHGEDLPVTTAAGLALAPAFLGGNLYVSTEAAGLLRGVYVLGEAPTIEPVTTFTGTTALFKGKVVSNELFVTYHFEYSTDGENWIKLPSTDVEAGAQPGEIEVEQEATGLTGSQLYHVRLVQNRPEGGGTAASDETTFTTPAVKPAVAGGVAWPIEDTSATLSASLDPQNQVTTYRFEYGFADCSANPCVSVPVSNATGGGPRLVSQSVSGLQPDSVYHYRLVATNASGTTAGPDRAFRTFAPGANLPDSRAYELVTPPDSGAVVLAGVGFGEFGGRSCFDTFSASPDGNSVLSQSKGGSLPGLSVNGFFDLYESVRSPTGWNTISKSPSTLQSNRPQGGLCATPDHRYSTLVTGSQLSGDSGTFAIEGKASSYVREPDGNFDLIGQGSLDTDPEANIKWISSDGAHIVFSSRRQLEPGAPPTGREGVYDRTADGTIHVISLPPAGASPEVETEFEELGARYQGASIDGTAVAFKVGGTMYVRSDDAETVVVAAAPNTFAGTSRDGGEVFYEAGEGFSPAALFAFDVATETATEIAPESTFVNVSEDGSHVYFSSESALTGSEVNDHGEEAVAEANNLYAWDRGSEETHFVAILAPSDVQGAEGLALTQWTRSAVSPTQNSLNGRANDPSRTTPDGSVLVFESRADVTGYEAGGHVEIYRYDAENGDLDCVSCSPLEAAAGSDARLQVPPGTPFRVAGSMVHIQNVTDDGRKVVFETQDALVPADLNGTWDVYEWVLGEQPYLISPGKGSLPSHLYAMTPNGGDIFFASTERLVPRDLSSVSSIYDAREGGGFVEGGGATPCLEDSCQGIPSSPPPLSGAGSTAFQGPRNPTKHKGAKKHHHRKRHKHKKHHHHHHHHRQRANDDRGAAR